MIIKELKAREIKDTRGDKTIEISLKTDFGKFSASAPNGKSRGKFEAKPYKKSLAEEIKIVNGVVGEIKFERFDDLKNLEKIFRKKVGANTIIAVEYVFLKALAKKNKKKVWELINSKARRFPMPIGNAIGGGAHSNGKKPDFQEFWFIPKTKTFSQAVKLNKLAWKLCKKSLKAKKTNDENAWQTSLNNTLVMDIMKKIAQKYKLDVGIDAASSEFYKKKIYHYKNHSGTLNKKQQINLMARISNDFKFIEDPLEQNDFSGFAELRKKSKGIIIGDDLTVTNLNRIKKAHKMKSINAMIIKPNQNGSLIEVAEIVKFCRKNKIKMIFSHRSGETSDNILADLAFGFQADFIKTGITGKGRDEKLNRLVEIEKRIGK